MGRKTIMIRYIKIYIIQYFWFLKESISFMKHSQSTWKTIWLCIFGGMSHNHAKTMIGWMNMSSDERQNWYETTDRRI